MKLKPLNLRFRPEPLSGKLLAGLLLAICLFGGKAGATPAGQELRSRMRIVSPASASLKFFKAPDAEIYAVAAEYAGGPLPGKKSVVARLSPPESGRVHASYFQGTVLFAPFQTAPVWVGSLGKIPALTEYALWQEKTGEWGAMIALVGGGLRTYLYGDGKDVLAIADSLDSHYAPSMVPLLALGWGRDPFKLTSDLYAFGLKTMKELDPQYVIGRLRVEKKFPEIWGYAGWCSWNAYYRSVDQDKLLASAASIRNSGFPIRWMLIDDCWSSVNYQTMVPWLQGSLYLTGLEADAKKFPGGMKKTVELLKKDYGMKWVGVWHTFNGYWNGIQLDSPVGRELRDTLLPVSKKVAIPDPRSQNGARFWDEWYGRLAEAGVDFVKVDNQGNLPKMTQEILPVSRVSGQAHKNLEAAAEKYFAGNVMNCMEQNVDTVFQWEKTNLGRSSVDYAPFSYTNPRSNCVLNVFNSLWFTQLSWPDYDMWMTHDNHVDYYAVEHAISGGPIYTTDRPGQERWEWFWPLVFSDGKVIRPDEPALPLKRFLLDNPYLDGKPLLAFAPVRGAGMIAAWNVDKFFRPVKAELSPSDVEGIKGGRFAVYEQFGKKLMVLEREQSFPVRLSGWEVRLYSIVPVIDGFAPIGLVNKYISPATIIEFRREQGRARVVLAEAGTFAAYCEKQPRQVKLNGSSLAAGQLYTWQDGLLKVNIVALTDGQSKSELEIIY